MKAMTSPVGLEIRTLTIGHARRLQHFYDRLPAWIVNWFEPFSRDRAEPLIDHLRQAADGNAISLGLFAANGDILGHAFVLNTTSDQPVLGCGLSESVIGQGLGRRLLQAVIDEADRQRIPPVTLTVFKDNMRARCLYECFGFVVVGDATCRNAGDSHAMERVCGNVGGGDMHRAPR